MTAYDDPIAQAIAERGVILEPPIPVSLPARDVPDSVIYERGLFGLKAKPTINTAMKKILAAENVEAAP